MVVPTIKAADLASKLPADETLISYFSTDRELFAFVLTKDAIRATKLEIAGLEADVKELRMAIEAQDSQTNVLENSRTSFEILRALYQRLISPIESQVLHRHITIVPHGELHYLPFAALSDGTNFVLERYAVRILPSATTLLYLRNDKY